MHTPEHTVFQYETFEFFQMQGTIIHVLNLNSVHSVVFIFILMPLVKT